MSYIVSQMRKVIDSQKPYMVPIEVTSGTMSSPNILGTLTSSTQDDTAFTDFALRGNFQRGKVYYFRFKIHRIPRYFYSGTSALQAWTEADDLQIDLILKNEEEDENDNPPEKIATFVVPRTEEKEDSEKYVSFSYVFTPTKTFDTLGFRVYRQAYDILSGNIRTWLTDSTTDTSIEVINPNLGIQVGTIIQTKGPRISYINNDTNNDGDICELRNIMEEKEWLKFGYQSRPGGLIVVNKEPIRIGRSGIYEINNGTKITSFMIANPGGSEASKIDAFLLDYAYNGEES